jgi:hypothetical protein
MRILKTLKIKKETTEEIPYTDRIVCNKCERILWDSVKGKHTRPTYYHSLKQWDRLSRWDEEDHEFHLCQDCYSEVIESFRLPPLNPVVRIANVD